MNNLNNLNNLNLSGTALNKNLPNYQPFIEFSYNYDFDENGIFFYLGTLGKTNEYQNPHVNQQIKCFYSSLGKGHSYQLVGRELVNLRTLNEPFSYFGVDLGEDRLLMPTAYTIKNRNSSSHVLLNWTLEGTNDKVNFEILDRRIFKSNDLEKDYNLEKQRNQLKVSKLKYIFFLFNSYSFYSLDAWMYFDLFR